MKRIIAFTLILVLLMLSACSKSSDEDGIASIDTNVNSEQSNDNIDTEKDTTPQTNAPVNNQSAQNNQTDTTTQEKEPDNKVEQEPEEDNKSPVYDDSNATPASSFEYSLRKDGGSLLIKKFVGNEKDVIIPNYIDGYPVKSIGVASFSNTSAEKIVISENIEEIQPNAFSGNNLKTATVKSKSIKFIGGAFNQCSSLESITFMYDEGEFIAPIYYSCPNLKEVVFLCDAPKCDDNSYVFVDHKKAIIKYKKGTKGWDDIQNLINSGWDRILIEIQ